MNLQTIQKIANDSGIHTDSIRRMIKEEKLTPYQQNGFHRILIDLDEFNSLFIPLNYSDNSFDMSIFHV